MLQEVEIVVEKKQRIPWRQADRKHELLLCLFRLLQVVSTEDSKLWLLDGSHGVASKWNLFAETLMEQPIFRTYQPAGGESVRDQFNQAMLKVMVIIIYNFEMLNLDINLNNKRKNKTKVIQDRIYPTMPTT